MLAKVPGGAALARTELWRRWRHRVSLVVDQRTNSHFTGFLRLPTQFRALTGPVLRTLKATLHLTQVLTVTVLGCANGAEAVTIASEMDREHPGMAVHIHAYDIDPTCLAVARAGRYQSEEVLNNKFLEPRFVEFTFYRDDGVYVVRPELLERIEFAQLDVLDPLLRDQVEASDIVFAQNFLFHLKPAQARKALQNILSIVKPGGALFLDGVDLPLRQKFALSHRLFPSIYRVERIHREARRARAAGWPYSYWGLEPFRRTSNHWPERYSTIFFVPR